MLPNFFVVGAQKCATTSLHHYLAGHPEICLPAQKETKFFVSHKEYMHGIQYYESKYFSGWNGEKMVGEVDPDYMYFEHAIERIVADLAIRSLKFVFIFRNPVDRAFSHYLMTLRRGLESLPLDEAIKVEKERICKSRRSRGFYSYIDRGFYYTQVLKFLEYIDISEMFFLLWEDLVDRPEDSLRALFEFLNVSTEYVPDNLNKKFHQASVPRSMFLLKRLRQEGAEKRFVRLMIPWEGLRRKVREKLVNLNMNNRVEISLGVSTRKILSNIYKEQNVLLAELIGRDLSHWDYGA